MTITAKVIADSYNSRWNRLTTFEIEYPRFILAEVNTHKMLGKNSASSRAIPIAKMHEHIQANPGCPISWGKNMPGMQAKENLEGEALEAAKGIWYEALTCAIYSSKELAALEVHKQIANRLTEPFQTMKTVITGTEWENFFWLRNHADAQPEFKALAVAMHNAMEASTPFMLHAGDWHLPYVDRVRVTKRSGTHVRYSTEMEGNLPLEDAKIISASCCAQVSYRKSDDSLEKAKMVHDRLVGSEPVHASPLEHQGTPIQEYSANPIDWEEGVTHMRKDGTLWSANLQGFVQLRQLTKNHTKW